VLPLRASAFLLSASLALAGCSLGARPPEPTSTPTPAIVAALGTPTPRPPMPSATPIPAPNVIGRVTPPAAPTSLPGAAAKLSVALAAPPSAAQIGLFLARERGFFLDGGVEVFFHATSSSSAALASLGGERDQLALVGADDVLKARAQGTPIVSVLALDGRGADGYGLVLATTDPLRAAAASALKAFATAAVRGYAEAVRDPAMAVDTLARVDSAVDRQAATRHVNELVTLWRAAGPMGLHDDARWREAHRRLVGAGQAKPDLDAGAAFTNELALAAAPTPTPAPSPTPRPAAASPTPTLASAPLAPSGAAPISPPPAAVPTTPTAAPPGAAPPAPPGAAPPSATPAPALQPVPTPRVATP
jgi:hypothetical protein